MEDVIFGIYPVINLLKKDPKLFKKICILNNKKITNKIKEIFINIKKYNIPCYKVKKQWLDKKTNNHVHQGILGLIYFKQPKYHKNDIIKIIKKFKKPFILMLDRITDPHNLGACIRTAVAAKVNIIILSKHHSSKLNSTVKKVSCGTSEQLPIIFVNNLVQIINLLKNNNITIIGTDTKSKNILFDKKIYLPICVIMGSEHKGIRPIIKNNCDMLLNIPLFNNVNSLNVSVSTGIFLFEIIRQNLFLK
ncbi:23S rRNA (guanosine(2251)-2'-O)-methyltransferase RlmB [Enterobacteriaceae endosymbiont of Plateumaris consimilis]|uniref:23S rRNA (guanosine(2251)-2'-O)-methyltransferase RlmB n=1 Tax=Enterobacteriaceae endosymbiont of Plateumaris consimilis TaxID=2675794 RepID=UPI001449402A|nr:23S rRNA (guanosine(2251)-2'-O)-methyltransferase RlmB [Enterobacteriaceae endosymbiont of Plateumaris consimilis]QJC28585.1 23S rRNA (guanosine(2251)-2'-O)-methyltransferase RlmB [Enterobacteriaceae endosymbiont of Plateumaris consimilis]